MTRTPLSERQQAQAEELVDALRPRMERLLEEVAALFAATADTHPFGPTEVALRDLVHAAAADLLQAALREKKTATRELPSSVPAASTRRASPAIANAPPVASSATCEPARPTTTA